MIAGTLLANALAYAFHFVAGRTLGPEEYGDLGAVMALYVLLSMPLSSLVATVSKYTNGLNSNTRTSESYSFQKTVRRNLLALSVLLLAVLGLTSGKLVDYLHITSRPAIFSLGALFYFNALLAVANGVLLAFKKYALYSISTFVESLIRLILLILSLYFGFGYFGALLAFGMAYLITYIILLPIIREESFRHGYYNFESMKPVYKYFFQLLVFNFMIQFMLNIPILLIKHYCPSEIAGYWTAALNVARISLFISGTIGQVMFTEMLDIKDHLLSGRLYLKAISLTLLGSSVVSILFAWKADFIVASIYGSAYLAASPYLKILGFVMILMGVVQVWSSYKMARLK